MKQYTRRDFLKATLMAGAFAGLSTISPGLAFGKEEGKYNVLFIAVDDLRPTLGCYGAPVIKTPNIDALAARGTVFTRAYCQQAVCSPSRTSLLTGLRPDSTKVYNLEDHFRKFIPNVVTLPEYFKKHGYHTQAMGKIYHPGLDDPQSWSVPHWAAKAPTYLKPESLAQQKELREKLEAQGRKLKDEVVEKDPKTGLPLKIIRRASILKGPAWEDPDCPDNALADGMIADHAIETLREIKDKKFFLAVGFHKPHLPFVAPKKYFDMYAGEKAKIGLSPNPFPPKDCPEIALTTFGELRSYTDIPDVGPIPDEKALELRYAYYAAASYTDAQIGRVLNELDKLGLRDKTIVVLWGDHGWHLGDHSLWCKHTNFEVATRSPLIISAPGQKNKGAKTDALVEFVDIYPTLCELAGLPIPDNLEGTSAVPVMNNPKRKWKKAAFSQYPRPGNVMGYSMRTDRYRYTEWIKRDSGDVVAVELYDYEKDPLGNVNIAGLPENKELVAKLSKQLRGGWKEARP
ncbi:MAG: sulfatase-like hydrolase/transferase [Armatimonadota bacterium]|nr:sulfatase-like hydrolase/transferase [Armatimonadota bacterium]